MTDRSATGTTSAKTVNSMACVTEPEPPISKKIALSHTVQTGKMLENHTSGSAVSCDIGNGCPGVPDTTYTRKRWRRWIA